ncbi:MAG: hypothetical protein GEV07_14175 [Streptosporangiales bacterium]|nr:hypothetical protein [Streptosporangiales bacterium]
MKNALTRGGLALATVAALFAAGCGSGEEASYPDRDITFIVPYATGGSTDPLSRQYSELLGRELDTKVVVQNKDGGSATIGTGEVVKAKADGYTIGLSSNSALSYQPTINDNLPYDSPDDYQPIVKLVDLPNVIAVQADSPWKSFDDLLDHAKKNPGKVRVGTSGEKTAPDLTIRELNRKADVDFTPVPFTGGGGEALTALLGGRVDAVSGYGPSLKSQVDAGKLRVIGTFWPKTYKMFPEADSIVQAGYDVQFPAAYYVIAPKGMPANVRKTLVSTSRELVKDPKFEQFIEDNGYLLDVQTEKAVDKELADYRKSFEELNEHLDE